MTDIEVLSHAMGWRWEGELARKRRKAGKVTDFTNDNDSSKPDPRSRFWGIQGCRVDENEVPERLGHLPGSKTLKMTENPDFFRISQISRISGVENA